MSDVLDARCGSRKVEVNMDKLLDALGQNLNPVDFTKISVLKRDLLGKVGDGVSVRCTGSRLFGYGEDDSDYDLVVLDENLSMDEILDKYTNMGYERSSTGGYSKCDGFRMFRNKDTDENLIVTNSAYKFDIWCRCNKLVSRFKMSDRDTIHTIFSIMIDDYD